MRLACLYTSKQHYSSAHVLMHYRTMYKVAHTEVATENAGDFAGWRTCVHQGVQFVKNPFVVDRRADQVGSHYLLRQHVRVRVILHPQVSGHLSVNSINMARIRTWLNTWILHSTLVSMRTKIRLEQTSSPHSPESEHCSRSTRPSRDLPEYSHACSDIFSVRTRSAKEHEDGRALARTTRK